MAKPGVADGDGRRGWVEISYFSSISAQLAFAAFAVGYARSHRHVMNLSHTTSANPETESCEGFVTARGTQKRWRLAWSFFAGSMGAWTITGPPAYAVHAGMVVHVVIECKYKRIVLRARCCTHTHMHMSAYTYAYKHAHAWIHTQTDWDGCVRALVRHADTLHRALRPAHSGALAQRELARRLCTSALWPTRQNSRPLHFHVQYVRWAVG